MGQDPREIIKQRISVLDIIAPYVKLKKTGQNYTGLCPFHNEKTPSFSVSPEKNFYHCFGCGEHGDIFEFVMKKQGFSFSEAMEMLASKAGVVLEKTPEAIKHQKTAKDLYALHAFAQSFYHKRLFENEGRDALNYLKERGIDDELIHLFGLGYAPQKHEKHDLKKALLDEGFTENTLKGAGIFVGRNPNDQVDRFRGRLIFPITNFMGKTIAFGGRTLNGDHPKYLNSAETDIFQKNRELYHAPKLDRTQPMIVVEGYTDVIALHKFGFQGLAPLGTAMSENHIEALWKMNNEPYVCLDGDLAGRNAAVRMINRALPLIKPGKSFHFITLSQDHDPDTFLKTYGAQALKEKMTSATPLFEHLFNYEAAQKSLSTPERKAEFSQRLKKGAENIQDATVKRYYLSFIFEKTRELFKPTRKKSQKEILPPKISTNQLAVTKEKALLVCCIKYPELLSEFFEELGTLHLSHPLYDELLHALLAFILSGPLDKNTIVPHLEEHGYARLLENMFDKKVLMLVPFAQNDTIDENVRHSFEDLLGRFKKTFI